MKRLGARNSLVLGMTLYVAYVGCFVIAIHHQDSPTLIVYSGAAVGGIGAGILWTAQGVYFSQAVEESGGDSVSLAGIFAFWYLGEEVALRLLSTFLLHFQLANWQGIFGLYTIITIVSAIAMLVGVDDFSVSPTSHTSQTSHASKYVTRTDTSPWHKATAAIRLLVEDSKMRHMIGLNAAYGFASAFMNSYINGEVVVVALQDDKWLGLLTSYCSAVAAGMSLIFGKWKDQGSILVGGAICFGIVGFLFFLVPLAEDWGWIGLLFVYFLMGVGRSTFEGTLKATFADYFAYEKEGAFANIIVQNGFCGSIGYICK